MDNPRSVALCGDPTCESPGCTQAAIDAYRKAQWDAAGEYVYGLLGLPYKPEEATDD